MKNQPTLPRAIKSYIDATNSSDLEKFLTGFKQSAVVTDEGEVYQGIKRIKDWRKKTTVAFEFKLELTNLEFTDDEIIVGTNCIGNFPGSPVMLQHHFELEDELIIAISITG
jgi:hypothetical protein